jgi:glutamate/tyrosine decarboxylase-like PLP-dependent enzyme
VTLPERLELDAVIALAAEHAGEYLRALDELPARTPGGEAGAARLGGPLPEQGVGAVAALRELIEQGEPGLARTGPRFFHFVQGGATPAALGADWLTTTWDQNSWSDTAAPFATRLETIALRWLLDLFELPTSWGGVLTTGATGANLVALACARRWWGQRHDTDVDTDGLAGLPPVPVIAGGHVHPSDLKALTVLGIGRSATRICGDATGQIDLERIEQELRSLNGAPAILIGSAGEVNAGAFDPLEPLADLAERYGCWLHVDGAFGLFAAVSPSTRHLVAGADRADSVIADGHKWLNVPYDCGFAFVRDRALMTAPFELSAAYLVEDDDEAPAYGYRAVESSRRARCLTVWATLRAYGRDGYRAMVERHLELTQLLARLVDDDPELERLADVPLNVVCFRYRPEGVPEEELDALNRRIGAGVIADGAVYFGTTLYGGRVAFRPVICNWMTRESDIEAIVATVRRLGAEQLAR